LKYYTGSPGNMNRRDVGNGRCVLSAIRPISKLKLTVKLLAHITGYDDQN
jgi:hypothetical protein